VTRRRKTIGMPSLDDYEAMFTGYFATHGCEHQ